MSHVGLLAEPLAEPPARPPDVSDPEPGYTRRAGSGAERYLTRPLTPCVYCNSGSGFDQAELTKVEESNESCLDYKNKPPATPEPSLTRRVSTAVGESPSTGRAANRAVAAIMFSNGLE